MPPRFHLDEHLSPMIAVALRRRGVDVTTAADAGLLGAPTTGSSPTPRPTGGRW